MKAVILVVFVLTVAAVLCLLEAYREQQYFKVTEDGVVSRRLNGLKKEKKIVFLSDLHNKEYGVGNERLLDAICKARPDLILDRRGYAGRKERVFRCSGSEICFKTACDRSGLLCLRKSRAADEEKTGSLWGGLSGVSKAIRRMRRAFSGK